MKGTPTNRDLHSVPRLPFTLDSKCEGLEECFTSQRLNDQSNTDMSDQYDEQERHRYNEFTAQLGVLNAMADAFAQTPRGDDLSNLGLGKDADVNAISKKIQHSELYDLIKIQSSLKQSNEQTESTSKALYSGIGGLKEEISKLNQFLYNNSDLGKKEFELIGNNLRKYVSGSTQPSEEKAMHSIAIQSDQTSEEEDRGSRPYILNLQNEIEELKELKERLELKTGEYQRVLKKKNEIMQLYYDEKNKNESDYYASQGRDTELEKANRVISETPIHLNHLEKEKAELIAKFEESNRIITNLKEEIEELKEANCSSDTLVYLQQALEVKTQEFEDFKDETEMALLTYKEKVKSLESVNSKMGNDIDRFEHNQSRIAEEVGAMVETLDINEEIEVETAGSNPIDRLRVIRQILSEKIKESGAATKRSLNLQEKLSELQKECENVQKENECLTKELVTLRDNQKYKSLERDEYNSLKQDEQIRSYQQKLSQLKEELVSKTSECEDLHFELEEMIERENTESNPLKEKIKSLEQELQKQNAIILEFKDCKDDSQANSDFELNDMIESLNEKDSLIAEMGNRIDELQSELYQKEDEIGRMNNELSLVNKYLPGLLSHMESIKQEEERIEVLEKALKAKEENLIGRKAILNKRGDFLRSKNEISKESSKIEDTSSQMLKSELDEREEELRQKSIYIQGLEDERKEVIGFIERMKEKVIGMEDIISLLGINYDDAYQLHDKDELLLLIPEYVELKERLFDSGADEAFEKLALSLEKKNKECEELKMKLRERKEVHTNSSDKEKRNPLMEYNKNINVQNPEALVHKHQAKDIAELEKNLEDLNFRLVTERDSKEQFRQEIGLLEEQLHQSKQEIIDQKKYIEVLQRDLVPAEGQINQCEFDTFQMPNNKSSTSREVDTLKEEIEKLMDYIHILEEKQAKISKDNDMIYLKESIVDELEALLKFIENSWQQFIREVEKQISTGVYPKQNALTSKIQIIIEALKEELQDKINNIISSDSDMYKHSLVSEKEKLESENIYMKKVITGLRAELKSTNSQRQSARTLQDDSYRQKGSQITTDSNHRSLSQGPKSDQFKEKEHYIMKIDRLKKEILELRKLNQSQPSISKGFFHSIPQQSNNKENFSSFDNLKYQLSSAEGFESFEMFKKARSSVIDLIQKFCKMGLDYYQIDKQLLKDREQIKGLCKKKKELIPFNNELEDIIDSSIADLIRNKAFSFKDVEMNGFTYCIKSYDALYMEIQKEFAEVNVLWKERKSRYIDWNKRLAAYCDKKIGRSQSGRQIKYN